MGVPQSSLAIIAFAVNAERFLLFQFSAESQYGKKVVASSQLSKFFCLLLSSLSIFDFNFFRSIL
jgi:hypothetical protein